MTVIEVRDLCVTYPHRRGQRAATDGFAVRDITFSLERGEIFGIVGESGSGKTTVARCVAGYQTATGGLVSVGGNPMTAQRSSQDRRHIQMVFQDPYSSLNPAMTLRQALREPIAVHGLRPKQEINAGVEELMELVGLDRGLLDAKPRRLSGGQRQRAAIARALAVQPEVLVADEPVSALDVSVQAVVLNLLADLREKLGMSILFISHDMAVVSHMCDRVAVMSKGRIVESGPVDEVFLNPVHPYTRELVAAVPPHPWLADEHSRAPGTSEDSSV